MKKPIIGLNMDFNETGGGFARTPWHALRSNYFDIIHRLGGIPIGFPCTTMDVASYVNLVDGIYTTGGNDYDPALYGEKVVSPYTKIMKQRSLFDMALIREVLKKNKPLLGVCGGSQALNIVFGGTLYQHLPADCPQALNHMGPGEAAHTPCHTVDIVSGTKLSKILGDVPKIDVNSFHHQAVHRLGESLVVNAKASDGIIEGFEHPDYRFCIGVQWHPEFSVTPYDEMLIQAFIEACAGA